MKIAIEIPKMNDFDRINELAKQVHDMHVNWRPDIFLSTNEVISKIDFKDLIHNKEIFVEKKQDEILRYITFKIKEVKNANMRYRKQLSIEAICVDEKNRDKGIGTLLLEFVENAAKEKGCTDMYLTVNEENINAIKLYEKFGFNVKNISYLKHI